MPNEGISHAKRFALLPSGPEACRHQGRMMIKLLDPPRLFRERRINEYYREAPRAPQIGLKHNRDHAAKPRISCGQIVLRCDLRPGYRTDSTGACSSNPAPPAQRRCAMSFHAQSQRFKLRKARKLSNGPAIARPVLQKRHLSATLCFLHHRDAAHHVRMTIQVFGGGMDHHIETGFDWR